MTVRGPIVITGMLVAGIVIGVLAAGAGAMAVHYTNTTEFCTGCHVYDEFARDFRSSSHWQNVSGARAGCADCHVPGDSVVDMLRVKALSGAGAYWAYYVEGVDTPGEFAARRPALQQVVHAWFKQRDSGTCRSCHAVASMLLAEQSAGARAAHQAAARGGPTCVDCHSGVPHGHAGNGGTGGGSS